MTEVGLNATPTQRLLPSLRKLVSDPSESQARFALIVLCIAAVALRLGYAATVEEADAIVGWDGFEYLAYANSILAGTSDAYAMRLNSIRPPFYPIFLAGSLLVTSWVVPFVQIVQCLLGGALVAIAYRIARLASCPRGALVAAALVAFCPHLIFLSAFLYTETLFAFFLWAGLCIYMKAEVPETPRASWLLALSSILIGLAALTRPTVLLLAPFMAVLLLVGPGFSFPVALREAVRRCAVFAGIFLAVVTPWMFRNLAVHGEFTLAPRHGAFILAFGNAPQLLTVYEATNVDEYYARQNGLTARFEVEGGLPQSEWLKEPWQFVRNDTGNWLRLEMYKVGHFWTPWVNPMLYGRSIVIVSALYSVPVFLLGIFGIWRLVRRRSVVGRVLLLTVVIGFLTGGLIFHTQVRYRIPFVDIAFAIAAGTVFCRSRADREPESVAEPGVSNARAI